MLRRTSLRQDICGQHGASYLPLKRIKPCYMVFFTRIPPRAGRNGITTKRPGKCRPPWLSPCKAATGHMEGGPPRDWTQVVTWSRTEFRRCVSPEQPDSAVHLAKCCLLVALEEEAARCEEAPHPELDELMKASSGSLRPRSAASASTWSGERIEALAAEVAALLDQQLEESAQQNRTATAAVPAPSTAPSVGAAEPLAPAADISSSTTAAAAANTSASDAEEKPECAGTPSLGTFEGPGPFDLPRGGSGTSSPTSSFDFTAEQEQLLDRIHTSRPGAVGSSSSTNRSGAAAPGNAGSSSDNSSSSGSGAFRDAAGGSADESVGGGGGEVRYYGSAWPTGRRLYGRRQALYRRYPVQTLEAVNTVLFDRHGYLPCNRYGVPSDHQLAAVMERGVGASAALSILYLAVCERLGFPLAARPLEDGRYFVLWPVDAPLTADGQRFLVDPYGRGGLLLLDEVCEIFGVAENTLRPATRRELLAALMGELRDAHWSAAVGCSPLPGTMTPLTVETALSNKVSVPTSGVRAASLRRALAAAEKRLWLLPDDSEAQLQYGLLLFFSRRYDDAWIELALFLERFAASAAIGGGGSVSGGDEVSLTSFTVTAVKTEEFTGVCDLGRSVTTNIAMEAPEAGPTAEAEAAPAEAEVETDAAVMPGNEFPESENVTEVGASTAGALGCGGQTSNLTAQVAVLVERIRLELDFAPGENFSL